MSESFGGLIPTFVKVTEEKLEDRPFEPPSWIGLKLVKFSSFFVAFTEIIFGYNFGAP